MRLLRWQARVVSDPRYVDTAKWEHLRERYLWHVWSKEPSS